MTTRYCTVCNSKLEVLEVDGHRTICCLNCSQIKGGYTEAERPIVEALQEHFRGRHRWHVSCVLHIFRSCMQHGTNICGFFQPQREEVFMKEMPLIELHLVFLSPALIGI